MRTTGDAAGENGQQCNQQQRPAPPSQRKGQQHQPAGQRKNGPRQRARGAARGLGNPGGNLRRFIACRVGDNGFACGVEGAGGGGGQRATLEGEGALRAVERVNQQSVVGNLATGDGLGGRAGDGKCK